MEQTQPRRARFGPFELDLRAGELHGNGAPILLSEQPFQVLQILIEGGGELVTREEIRKKLWPNDTIVEFDHSINTAIRKLRRALSDSADNPKYIETLGRRGYRLMVPVEWTKSDDDSSASDVGFPALRVLGSDAVPNADSETLSNSTSQSGSPAGRTVSHYRVLEVIGGGGMGVVYRAEDLKLGRSVALKFLPEEFGRDPRARARFEREARAASSLEHPNICPIYEFGEHQGQPFLVMPLLKGQTLREYQAALADSESKALPIGELLKFAIQIAEGLEAAHEKGIIHRDIKPANIFITSKGTAKILDFGVAKLQESEQKLAAAADGEGQLEIAPVNEGLHMTQTGAAVGTPSCMSPEQLLGEKLDTRTDLFSFGLVLYEMATGQLAFTGDNAAALRFAILSQAPTPAVKLNPHLPPKLSAIIDKCLQKDRDQRYLKAAEIVRDLNEVAQTGGRALSRRWILLGAAALVLMAVIAGALYWPGRRPKLTVKDAIVLADFQNTTGDVVFDGTLEEALAADLDQSPFLNVLSSEKVEEELKLMSHPADARLTPELAQDLCQRSGSKAVLAGSIASLGSHYVLGLTATNCYTGQVLAREEVEAENKDGVLKGLHSATSRVRQKLGESLTSVQKFDLPVEQVTTSSLEALKLYSLARKQPTVAAATTLYKGAIELDPNFAIAYLGLGNLYGNMYADELQREALAKAFELRSRASERERFEIESDYYDVTTAESDKARDITELWAQTYPRDPEALLFLGGIDMELGHYDQGVEDLLKCLAVDANQPGCMLNLEESYRAIGRYKEADDVLKKIDEHFRDKDVLHLDLYTMAFLRGDSVAMQEQITWAASHSDADQAIESAASDTAAYFGRLGAFREYAGKAINGASPTQQEPAAIFQARKAQWEAELGFKEVAVTDAKEALHRADTPGVKSMAGLALARAGEDRGALSLADELDREFPERSLWRLYWSAALRASVEINQANPEVAIKILEASQPYEANGYTLVANGTLYPAYIRGEAYLALHQGREAAVEFQKFLDHKGMVVNCPLAALARLGLARAYVVQGDNPKARAAYQDFLTLWKDADPDIPIYKQAKAEYAKLQ